MSINPDSTGDLGFPGVFGMGGSGIYDPNQMSQYAVPESDLQRQLRMQALQRLNAPPVNFTPATTGAFQQGMQGAQASQDRLSAMRGGAPKVPSGGTNPVTGGLPPSLSYLQGMSNTASAQAQLQRTHQAYQSAMADQDLQMRKQALEYGLRHDALMRRYAEGQRQGQALQATEQMIGDMMMNMAGMPSMPMPRPTPMNAPLPPGAGDYNYPPSDGGFA